MENVLGRTINLSKGRVVFLGTSKITPDTYYFGFLSEDGDELKFSLSREAKEALYTLLTNPMAGMPLRDFPHKKIWRQVKFSDELNPNAP